LPYVALAVLSVVAGIEITYNARDIPYGIESISLTLETMSRKDRYTTICELRIASGGELAL
jgi:hypothetical protein